MKLVLRKEQATEAVELLLVFGVGFVTTLLLLALFALITF